MIVKNARLIVKNTDIFKAEPQIPIIEDHTTGTWNVYNIYISELMSNVTDEKLWIRTNIGIRPVMLNLDQNTSNYIPIFNNNNTLKKSIMSMSGSSTLNIDGSVNITGKYYINDIEFTGSNINLSNFFTSGGTYTNLQTTTNYLPIYYKNKTILAPSTIYYYNPLITGGTNGALWINSDRTFYAIKDGLYLNNTGNNTAYLAGVVIGKSNEIWLRGFDNDNEILSINIRGYSDSTTRFRSTIIYNGKSQSIAKFNGSDSSTTLYGKLSVNYTGINTYQTYISGNTNIQGSLYINEQLLSLNSLPTFTLPHSSGGTGLSTLTNKGILFATSTSQYSFISPNSTTSNMFLSQVNSGNPVWSSISISNISTLQTSLDSKFSLFGSLANNYIVKVNSALLKTLTNSSIIDDGVGLGIGGASVLAGVKVNISGNINISSGSEYRINGTKIGITNLNGVSITTPSNGQFLTYNGSNWVNSNLTGTLPFVYTGSTFINYRLPIQNSVLTNQLLYSNIADVNGTLQLIGNSNNILLGGDPNAGYDTGYNRTNSGNTLKIAANPTSNFNRVNITANSISLSSAGFSGNDTNYTNFIQYNTGLVKIYTENISNYNNTKTILLNTGDISIYSGDSYVSGSTAATSKSGNITIKTGSAYTRLLNIGSATATSGDIRLIVGTSYSFAYSNTINTGIIGLTGNTIVDGKITFLDNATFFNKSTDPVNYSIGTVYYNTTTNKLRVRTNTAWVDLH